MKNSYTNSCILIFLALFLFTMPSFSQILADGLVINEVYFNEKNPESNWVKITNPTKTSLILQLVRTSHVKTINILPAGARNIEIKPEGKVILVASEKVFFNTFPTVSNIVEVKPLQALQTGGVLVVLTKDKEENSACFVRFGNPTMSAMLENDLLLKEVIPFSKDSKSFSREIKRQGNKIIVGTFSETIPSFSTDVKR